jgi:hypothetical protein
MRLHLLSHEGVCLTDASDKATDDRASELITIFLPRTQDEARTRLTENHMAYVVSRCGTGSHAGCCVNEDDFPSQALGPS